MAGIGGVGSYSPSGIYWYGYNRAAAPNTAVEAVTPVKAVTALPASGVDAASYVSVGTAARTSQPGSTQEMLRRYESDPVGMAVRQRIRYVGGGQEAQEAEALTGAGEDGQEVGPAAETEEEAECQTCAERKYQDGSDDPGVSFKTPGHIAPENAASVVRGHEQEHVVREQAEADREGREVVQQSVTLHTAICPECGKVYVSGGTTRTVTAAQQEPQQQTAVQAFGFEAVA